MFSFDEKHLYNFCLKFSGFVMLSSGYMLKVILTKIMPLQFFFTSRYKIYLVSSLKWCPLSFLLLLVLFLIGYIASYLFFV